MLNLQMLKIKLIIFFNKGNLFEKLLQSVVTVKRLPEVKF